MREVVLWHRLESAEPNADVLAALLDLAGSDLERRAAIVPKIARLHASPDPRARRAAVALLAGMTGIVGLRAIVAALDDDDEAVRDAAVDALAQSCVSTPTRWVHALYHRRPEVRRRAASRTPDGARVLLAWSRADPAAEGLCNGAPWPPEPIALVDDLWRRGRVDADAAANGLRQCTVVGLRDFAAAAEQRAQATVASFLRGALTSAPLRAPAGTDCLDGWVEIAGRSTIAGAAVAALLCDVVAGQAELRGRLLAAICAVADRLGWIESLASLAFRVEPSWLAFPGVDATARRATLDAIACGDAPTTKLAPELVVSLLGGELVREDDGRPSLCRAATIAGWLPERRLGALIDAFGEGPALDRAASHLRQWLAVARLPLEEEHTRWIGLLGERDPDRAPIFGAVHLVARFLGGAEPSLGEPAWFGGRQAAVSGLLRISDDTALGFGVDVMVEAFDALAEGEPVPRAWWLGLALDHAPHDGLAKELLRREIERDAAGLAADAKAAGATASLVRWLEEAITVSEAAATALAAALAGSGGRSVEEFVQRVDRRAEPSPEPRPPVSGPRRLTAAEFDRIATCDVDALDDAVAPALHAPTHGLTDALARRDRSAPSLAVAAALVACTDGLEAVAVALARFADDRPGFLEDLRYASATLWRDADAVPPLVDAILVAFPRNTEGLATWFELQEGGYGGVLRSALELPSPAREILWSAIAEVLSGWSFQGATRRLAAGLDRDLVDALRDVLDTEVGPAAAKILVALHRGRVAAAALSACRSRVVDRASSYSRATHDALSWWVPLRGVAAPRDAVARPLPRRLPADERAEITRLDDVAALLRVCAQGSKTAVAAAVGRLLELEGGPAALVVALAGELAHADVVLASIERWPAAALVEARALLDQVSVAVSRRFRIAMALVRRGDARDVDAALAVAREAGAVRVALPDDFAELMAHAGDAHACAEVALGAADPLVADAALAWLLAASDASDGALRTAVAGQGGASDGLRRAAAVKLLDRGDRSPIALALRWLVDPQTADADATAAYGRWFATSVEAADALVDAALVGGPSVAAEARVLELLMHASADVRGPCLARLLVDCNDPATRKRIVDQQWLGSSRAGKLRELAQTFAWGVMRGRELTGKVFAVHMTPKREQWGYTHLGGTAIHVTPVPILARVPRGRDVVEGLLLHEIGHHIWHGGKVGMRVWGRAQRQGLHQLLNLIADEHLERNLRSLDAEFGDRIKRLDAYAFQHAPSEHVVMDLLTMLRADAVPVLSDVGPSVAYASDCVRIEGGRVLARLDELGHSFARFVRALRMGLGNRSGDPKVEEALTYFGAGFRGLDMHGLMRVTRAIAKIFGGEARLAAGFGGHEAIGWNERESDVAGEGIRDDEVQREVQRILEPPRGGSANPRATGGMMINVGGDAYAKITKVQPVARDPAVHHAVASAVRRDASRLRETLERLGLGAVVTGGRLRGHAIDRSRLRGAVVRRDPRLLRAREPDFRSDLFLGVVVDCSGSMSGANLERAKRFAVLVAEAARGLPGVDSRFFGFTDQVIFDAGTAERCAASSLVAGGGNNDAAALDHVANVAAQSRRAARLIVMISDGMPTECSVGALRGVVRSLTRRHNTCCAQVAVQPLAEVCFPNYVLLNEENLERAVRRFAELIARLVGRVLSV